MNDCPGLSFGLNNPSKNCVAQCASELVAGFVNVTVVPTGTRMFDGYIAATAVESGVAVADALVRASSTVLPTVLPSTWAVVTSRRTYGGVGVAACGTVPFSLKAHRMSPFGMVLPYGMPVPPEYTATY